MKMGVDMFEVTRLTREGRLQEAMDMLRGVSPAADTEQAQGQAAPRQGDDVATIDLVRGGQGGGGPWQLPETGGRIREVPNFLATLGQAPFSRHGAEAAVPQGAMFEERMFSNEHGACTYKLYVPSTFKGEAMPLIVMLHGCTQSPDDFARGTRMNEVAEAEGFLVAYPAQSQSSNASRCWNWFARDHQRRGQGEPSLIAGLTRQVMEDFPVVPGKVFIAGLSAGGAAAAIMGETYPELFAAIGVHSGLACGAASDMASAFGAMRNGAGSSPRRETARTGAPERIVPTIVFHGDQDTTVHPINGDQIVAQAVAKGDLRVSVGEGQEAGGVRYTRTLAEDRDGMLVLEHWRLHGGVHAWSGGSTSGSFTTPGGPDASREMVRFFLKRRAS